MLVFLVAFVLRQGLTSDQTSLKLTDLRPDTGNKHLPPPQAKVFYF